MEEKEINTRESLEIITRMISTTRESMEQSSAVPFLAWGYATVLVAIVIYFAFASTGNIDIFWIWFAIPVIGGISTKIFNRRIPTIKSPISTAVSRIWLAVGLLALPFSLATFFIHIPGFNILFFIAFFMAIGTLITGILLRSATLQVCSCIAMPAPVAILFCHSNEQILIFAAAFLVMMVIPGHIMLYKRAK